MFSLGIRQRYRAFIFMALWTFSKRVIRVMSERHLRPAGHSHHFWLRGPAGSPACSPVGGGQASQSRSLLVCPTRGSTSTLPPPVCGVCTHVSSCCSSGVTTIGRDRVFSPTFKFVDFPSWLLAPGPVWCLTWSDRPLKFAHMLSHYFGLIKLKLFSPYMCLGLGTE